MRDRANGEWTLPKDSPLTCWRLASRGWLFQMRPPAASTSARCELATATREGRAASSVVNQFYGRLANPSAGAGLVSHLALAPPGQLTCMSRAQL